MPTIPRTGTLKATTTGADVLNAIRNSASSFYREQVPKAIMDDQESLRGIGNTIMSYQALKNEFIHELLNRIGMMMVKHTVFNNPWAMFKKGLLEFGETIEEIFVSLAHPHEYDPEVAEKEVFKREIPDVTAVFHRLNYQKFYKQTIQNDTLRQAFLSWDGITDFIAKIVDAMYTAANYDEFLTMKYVIALNLLRGNFTAVEISPVNAANMKAIASTLKGTSNILEFANTEYNEAGVMITSPKESQYLIVNARFDATMDVEVLASSFNMDKAEFMGHRVLVDSFGNLDMTRLRELFKHDPSFEDITEDQLQALDAIPAVLVDKDWFMIFDNMMQFTEIYNAEGLYWNYFYHVWKTFSHSPFATAIGFVAGVPEVTGIEITPSAVTVGAGQKVQLTANVTVNNFASKGVTWSTDSEDAYVDAYGTVQLATTATGTITVTATSKFDSPKTATATINVQ